MKVVSYLYWLSSPLSNLFRIESFAIQEKINSRSIARTICQKRKQVIDHLNQTKLTALQYFVKLAAEFCDQLYELDRSALKSTAARSLLVVSCFILSQL
jgi:hypothetical protein